MTEVVTENTIGIAKSGAVEKAVEADFKR